MAPRKRASQPAAPKLEPDQAAEVVSAPARAARVADVKSRRQIVPTHIIERHLDELLDGLFGWPVDLDDMITAHAQISKLWPDAIAEVKHYHGREVVVLVWFGSPGMEAEAAIVRRLHAP